MLQHNLTLAWRQLVKYRLQSLVSIVSLAIGFACFALASMWIKYETTYDGFHRDADKLYFLVKDHSEWGKAGDILENVNTVFCDTVYKHCPEIVESALFERPYFQPKEGKMERYIACDSSFFDFFDIRLLVGDRGFLQRKGEIAITRQKAEEWWPGENPLGKELEDKYGKHFVVSAIVEGWDTHTNLTFAFLSGDSEVRMYPSSGGQYAVRLAPKADVKSINQRLDTLKINYYYWDEDGYRNHIGANGGFELIAAKELRHRLNYEQMEVQIHHIYLFALAGGMLILCGLLNYLT
ncbi:MAG: ABC transporter permease, partial [Bacteroidaceae bacterium]|nr:ABC transporter permease [Bacteroidaceae bacterium]